MCICGMYVHIIYAHTLYTHIYTHTYTDKLFYNYKCIYSYIHNPASWSIQVKKSSRITFEYSFVTLLKDAILQLLNF